MIIAVASVIHIAAKFMYLHCHTKRAIAIHLEGIFLCILRGQKVFLVCPRGEGGEVELLILSGRVLVVFWGYLKLY